MSDVKILIVDDEDYVCDFLSEFLEMKGYRSKIAHSGKEMFEILSTETFNLILLDLIMPEMSGLRALEKLKEIGLNIPVIMLTCIKDDETAVNLIKMGAVDYVTKPIDIERLEQSIIINIAKG